MHADDPRPHDTRREPAGRGSDRERRLELLIRRLPARLQCIVRWLRRPSARWVRIAAAVLLMLGGVFSILPVLGLWMLPLGLVLLAEDVRPLRRCDRPHPCLDRAAPAALDGTVARAQGLIDGVAGQPRHLGEFCHAGGPGSRPGHRQPGVHRAVGRPSARGTTGAGAQSRPVARAGDAACPARSIVWLVHLTDPVFVVAGNDFSWRDLILIGGGGFLLFKGPGKFICGSTVSRKVSLRVAQRRASPARSCRSCSSISCFRSTASSPRSELPRRSG